MQVPDGVHHLLGYGDRLSAAPGDTIRFMVSAEADFDARVVRLCDRANVGRSWEVDVPSAADGRYPARRQRVRLGSFARVQPNEQLRLDGDLTFHAWILPTIARRGQRQVVAQLGTGDGWQVALDDEGRLGVTARAGGPMLVVGDRPLRDGNWYFVAVRLQDATNSAELHCTPAIPQRGDEQGIRSFEAAALPVREGGVLLAGGGDAAAPESFFNGKLANPALWAVQLSDSELASLRAGARPWEIARGALRLSLDFALGRASTRLIDRGPLGIDGATVNGPLRAVTGPRWDGSVLDVRSAPEQYDAIHFHEDDLDDARWEPNLELVVPGDMASGVYALRLDDGDGVDHVPFTVLPSGPRRAPVTVVLPTLSYVAYANMRGLAGAAEELAAGAPVAVDLSTRERQIEQLPEIGLSLYNEHVDGTVCQQSTRLRPILDMRPDYVYALTGQPRHFAQDLGLIGWLERKGCAYDVITDEQLSDDPAALTGTSVAISGSHPEYVTGDLRKNLAGFLGGGGRFMYLGGNGYYWVTATCPERPHLLEVRRGHVGTRAGNSGPGETHLAATGEPGGLWRLRGHPPQELVSIGFSAQGWRNGAAYRRLADADDPRAAFAFDGIEEELIGDGGPLGGAAGDELDRADVALGTPEDTLVLATSQGRHGNEYQIASEEARLTLPDQGGAHHPYVRADMALTDLLGGGRIFAVGSIAWTLQLGHPGPLGSAARLTANVLERFLAPE